MRLFRIRHRIATANLYVGNPAPVSGVHRLIAAVRPWRRPDSIGVQEVSDYVDDLRFVEGYQIVAPPKGLDRLRRANAVLVRDDLKVLHREFITAVPGTGTKYTPKRTIALVGYEKHGVRVMHINTHLHVVHEEELAYQRPEHWSRASKQYAEHSTLVVELAREWRSLGWTVFVTADGNTRPRVGVPDWSPALYAALPVAGFIVARNGVDLIAADRRHVEVLGQKLVSRKLTGSDDHDAIVTRYRRKRR